MKKLIIIFKKEKNKKFVSFPFFYSFLKEKQLSNNKIYFFNEIFLKKKFYLGFLFFINLKKIKCHKSP